MLAEMMRKWGNSIVMLPLMVLIGHRTFPSRHFSNDKLLQITTTTTTNNHCIVIEKQCALSCPLLMLFAQSNGITIHEDIVWAKAHTWISNSMCLPFDSMPSDWLCVHSSFWMWFFPLAFAKICCCFCRVFCCFWRVSFFCFCRKTKIVLENQIVCNERKWDAHKSQKNEINTEIEPIQIPRLNVGAYNQIVQIATDSKCANSNLDGKNNAAAS